MVTDGGAAQALRTGRLTAGLTYVGIGDVDVSATPKPKAVSWAADAELARSAERLQRAEVAAAVERRRETERARTEARRTEDEASEAVDSPGARKARRRALR